MTTILGDGIAAQCCATLLARAGLSISRGKTGGPKVPALLIGEGTQALIADVFERPDVFRGAARISKRIVSWGKQAGDRAEPIELPHSAIVISESELTGRLRSSSSEAAAESPDWTIRTTPSSEQLCFGTRMATASRATLRRAVARDACWIESLETGWLFLLPGWLLSVGGPAEDLLARSRLIGEQIESHDSVAGQFAAYPRVSDPLCGPGWLACGGAAMAFDPLCGDGVGNAVREAILACAVIKSITNPAKNIEIDRLFTHYRTRLIAGFLKHLELCRHFYAACSGEWWSEELARLDIGIEWCREQIGDKPEFLFQLRGFDLQTVS